MCCVVVCDLETSRIGAPYIYDISNLRVNSLCLHILMDYIFPWSIEFIKWVICFRYLFTNTFFPTVQWSSFVV